MASGFYFALFLTVTSGLLAAASCCEEDKKKAYPSCPAPCPPGWSQFGSRCFMFHYIAKNWMEAEKTCLSLGGNLASVTSLEEHEFLHDYILRVSGANRLTWIGGSDGVQERMWLWSDGTPFEYTHWTSGQPDNHRNTEHCLEMNLGGNAWNDRPCSFRSSFICSKRL